MTWATTGVATEALPFAQVVGYEFQYLAVYPDQRDNWWTAASTKAEALAAFERIYSQVQRRPDFRVAARWDTAKLKAMADFMALPTPSTAIH